MSATGITIPTEVVADPHATPPANITGDGNRVTVDPNKPAGDQQSDEKLILGKFKDQAALESAYTEAQKKITELSTKPEAKPTPTAEQAREAVVKAGLDLTAIQKEYTDNQGKLSEATLKTLEEKGITRDTVTTYINGLQAQASQMRSEFAKIAGSDDHLKSVYEWAATNMSPEDVQAYNAVVEGGNISAAKLALQAIVSQYKAAVGTDPNLVNGEHIPGNSGVQAFASTAEVITAMSDPRYQTDSAYRAKVEARMAGTELFSIRA